MPKTREVYERLGITKATYYRLLGNCPDLVDFITQLEQQLVGDPQRGHIDRDRSRADGRTVDGHYDPPDYHSDA
jgi:hypothetical protein